MNFSWSASHENISTHKNQNTAYGPHAEVGVCHVSSLIIPHADAYGGLCFGQLPWKPTRESSLSFYAVMAIEGVLNHDFHVNGQIISKPSPFHSKESLTFLKQTICGCATYTSFFRKTHSNYTQLGQPQMTHSSHTHSTLFVIVVTPVNTRGCACFPPTCGDLYLSSAEDIKTNRSQIFLVSWILTNRSEYKSRQNYT